MKRVLIAWLLAFVTLPFATMVSAQGVQTGIITGTVVDTSDLVLPGVTVTVTSPALQGVRSTVTDGNGVYVLRGLPPGVYEVTFELAGMRTERRTTTVEVGKPAEVMATLGVEGIAETVVVVADTVASTITSTTGGANYTNKEIDTLPTPRTLAGIAELAPGLTDNTPNAGQVTISGAFAYDNVFLIDGVDVNDNLFGNANALFVEDAIEETQVLTSGISAEYGRFSGGVINAVTKSGGDIFSGSYRLNLTNDAWTDETPYEKTNNITRPDKTNKTHEGTLGGPILKTRLWFFGSGRYTKTDTQTTLPYTGAVFNGSTEEKRGEIKLTGTVAQNHTFTGSYFKIAREAVRMGLAAYMIDPTIFEQPSFPNDRWVIGYRGVLSPRLFAELRWSQKTFSFQGSGGTKTAITDSPIWSLTQGAYLYNGAYFDATDPEDRNNWQVAGSVSYFLTTPNLGSHDFKGGFEVFNSRRTGGNSQTATGYVFDADFLTDASGDPIYDSNGKFIPVFVPGESYLENWLATRGAKVDMRTTSVFLQDSWKATRNLSFDLGVRYERARGEATGDIVPFDTDTWVPRLAATYDIKGDGRLVAQATYAWYAGKYSESQMAANTDVGNPSLVLAYYDGPAGQGLNCTACFDPNNYVIFGGDFPTANIFMDDNLSSPVNKEFTLSLGAQVGPGYVKGTYVQRSVANFVEDFRTLADGSTTVVRDGINYGTFTNIVYRNSDDPTR
ncbi:MAG: TonB-dependent receptor, partial [Vicinamibacteraceae bacterium]|nr:TonB-dependent receptor [Vicinamibacteraceae bacterium]